MSEPANSGSGRHIPSLISGLIGALLVAGVSIYNFNRQISLSLKSQQIAVFRELVKDFYHGDPLLKEIRVAVENCKPLYKQWGGTFTHDQINTYLGFFEDVGFFLKQDLVTIDAVGHLFGAYIIEAFEYREIRKYIALVQTSMDDPEAFKEFQELATRLESDPKRQRQVQNARDSCKGKL